MTIHDHHYVFVSKTILTLTLMLLLAISPVTKASIPANSDFKGIDFTSGFSLIDSRSIIPQALLVKQEDTFDESTDSVRRRGTENWEEPQGSFFVVPGLRGCLVNNKPAAKPVKSPIFPKILVK